MKRVLTPYLLGVVALLLLVNLAQNALPVRGQSQPQFKVVPFDPQNVIDQSQRLSDLCISESRAGWTFVSMGTVANNTYLVFRR